MKLTKQGYIINKKYITKEQLQNIENDLTIEPEIDNRFKIFSKDDSFNIYQETKNKEIYVVPRYYGIMNFGMPNDNNIKFEINDIDKINIKFIGNLRDYQIDVMNIILNEYSYDIKKPNNTLKKFGGSIISIPPGKGKTVLAINLITELKLKTLVIVHKTFLVNQWKERILQYTDANVGFIQQDTIDINGKQIVIAMLQSIVLRNYDKELFQAFPLIIFDECHHLGAKMFSKSLIKLQAPYYLGLSATPERKDKLDKVFKYFIGDIKYRGTFQPNNEVIVKMYLFDIINNNFKSIKNNFTKSFMIPKMITNLCKIEERNNLIINLLKDILYIDCNRRILILTGRCNDTSINHIKLLADKINSIEDFQDSWGYYKGGMKKIQLEISSEKQIILGTYEMAQEGLDIPELNTLILASPLKGDITQTVGRILRGVNQYHPLIIDIMDNLIPFSSQAKKRYNYYNDNKYKCEFYNINDGVNIIKTDSFFPKTLKKNIKDILVDDE